MASDPATFDNPIEVIPPTAPSYRKRTTAADDGNPGSPSLLPQPQPQPLVYTSPEESQVHLSSMVRQKGLLLNPRSLTMFLYV